MEPKPTPSRLAKASAIAAAALLVIGVLAGIAYLVYPGNPTAPITAGSDTSAIQADSTAGGPAAILAAIREKIQKAGNGRDAHAEIINAGFAVLAENLSNAEEKKFDPLSGFTHYSGGADPDGTWLFLIERFGTTPADPMLRDHDGLNIRIDPHTGAVLSMHYWGHRTAEK